MQAGRRVAHPRHRWQEAYSRWHQQAVVQEFERQGHEVDVFLATYKCSSSWDQDLLKWYAPNLRGVKLLDRTTTSDQTTLIHAAFDALQSHTAASNRSYDGVLVLRFDLMWSTSPQDRWLTAFEFLKTPQATWKHAYTLFDLALFFPWPSMNCAYAAYSRGVGAFASKYWLSICQRFAELADVENKLVYGALLLPGFSIRAWSKWEWRQADKTVCTEIKTRMSLSFPTIDEQCG